MLMQLDLLRRHMVQPMHIRSSDSHPLTRLPRLSWHTHSTGMLSAWHSTHRSICARLHTHHRARLTNVWLSRPRRARVHHRLTHMLRSRRHARMSVCHARMHTRLRLICGHHLVRVETLSLREEMLLLVERFR